MAKAKDAVVDKAAEKKEFQHEPKQIISENVKRNDLMAITHFVKVLATNFYGNQEIDVVNVDTNQPFSIRGKDLINRCASADQVIEEVRLARTKILELLVTSYNKPITVNFDKEPDKKTGISENRTLRGRLIAPEPLMGRSRMDDLDIEGPPEKRIRLADHRTLKYLIVDGVKYIPTDVK